MEPVDLTDEQKETLEELAQYNRMNVPSYLWDISREHMTMHDKYYSIAMSHYNENDEYPSEEYHDYNRKSQHSAYISIVFAAMYIEGSIYDFGCIYLGDKYIKENLDKLSTVPKLQVILKLVTGSELDTRGQAYEHFKRLVKYRNNLVHPKSMPLDFGEEAYAKHMKLNKEYEKAIESAKVTPKYLDKEIRTIHKDHNHPSIFGSFATF